LRWWNIVDSEGKNHWKFEAAKDRTRFDPIEGYIFWLALVAFPAAWILFIFLAFVTFNWSWIVVAALGAGKYTLGEKQKQPRYYRSFDETGPTCGLVFR
jgi:hypothetical protein